MSFLSIVKRKISGNYETLEFPLSALEHGQYKKRMHDSSKKAYLWVSIHGKFYYMPKRENSLVFKLKLIPESRKVEFSRSKNGYLGSEKIYFPHYVSIDYASENWNIAKDRLLNAIKLRHIESIDGKVARLELVSHASTINNL